MMMAAQGWCQSVGDAVNFQLHEYSLPNIAKHLSNYADMLNEKKGSQLNAHVTPYVCR